MVKLFFERRELARVHAFGAIRHHSDGERRVIYILLNLLPIAVATAVGLGIGYAWRMTLGSGGRMGAGMVTLAALGEFWLAAILAGALILAPPKADPWIMAIGSAVVIWAGFVLPAVAITLAHRGVAARGVVTDALHWLVVMTLQAVLMKAIGLVPPPPGS